MRELSPLRRALLGAALALSLLGGAALAAPASAVDSTASVRGQSELDDLIAQLEEELGGEITITEDGVDDTTTTTTPIVLPEAQGRIAFVTPAGDVVVADGDGQNALVVGTGAATNRYGLAPLAWRQPTSDAITYVREDGSLVVAPVNGDPERIVADDAVVPPDADERILSWELNGTLLAYIAERGPGETVAKVVDFTSESEDVPPEVREIGSPESRIVLAQEFSPTDPLLWQRTIDAETGEELTLAIVSPDDGRLLPVPVSYFDPVVSPDGAYLYAVDRSAGSVQQLVRVSILDFEQEVIVDSPTICHPAVSPDALKIAFAGGESCDEVWVVNADGTEPTRLTERVAGTTTFEVGRFSWSLDAQTITHANCRYLGNNPVCEGGYYDISVDGRSVEPGAEAGSVLREQVPLLRSVKAAIYLDGALNYDGKMVVGAESIGDELLSGELASSVTATAIDEADPTRSFSLSIRNPADSLSVSGAMTIKDGDFDEDFTFFGRLLPARTGYITMRGIWMQTQEFPIRTGQMLLTVQR